VHDRFQFERDVMVEDFSDVLAYHGDGVPGKRGPRATDPKRVCYLGAGRNPYHAPGGSSDSSNEAVRQTVALSDQLTTMLDDLSKASLALPPPCSWCIWACSVARTE
jgi:hypothetical protein